MCYSLYRDERRKESRKAEPKVQEVKQTSEQPKVKETERVTEPA